MDQQGTTVLSFKLSFPYKQLRSVSLVKDTPMTDSGWNRDHEEGHPYLRTAREREVIEAYRTFKKALRAAEDARTGFDWDISVNVLGDVLVQDETSLLKQLRAGTRIIVIQFDKYLQNAEVGNVMPTSYDEDSIPENAVRVDFATAAALCLIKAARDANPQTYESPEEEQEALERTVTLKQKAEAMRKEFGLP
jgi:hypothetical protein